MTPHFRTLAEAAAWFEAWLDQGALPLWADSGVDPAEGAFQEAISLAGAPLALPRRSRTQARQVWVYATAAVAGRRGPWLATAGRGFDAFQARYRRPDGLFVRVVDVEGRVLDETPAVYEQAFVLLAMAALSAADPGKPLADGARDLREGIGRLHHPAGGYREFGDRPFQANAHMHLLEAALAWEEAAPDDPAWRAMSDEIAGLALRSFIEPERGFVREFFDEAWRPLAGEDGLVEPGHQYEWAWLLDRWGRARDRADAIEGAARLYGAGLRGVDRTRNVAVNALWDDLEVRDATARLWPQTERLKAALIFDTEAEAVLAASGLAQYLDTPARGAWRDKMLPDGAFVDEAAPATSFYHLLGAILPLLAAAGQGSS